MSGRGYYSRARNLQKAAATIVANTWKFPTTMESLALPGVGDYTARRQFFSIGSAKTSCALTANVGARPRDLALFAVTPASRGAADSKTADRLPRANHRAIGIKP